MTVFVSVAGQGKFPLACFFIQMTSQELWHWELLHPDGEATVRKE